MPMRRESGRASGTGPPKKTKKIRKAAPRKVAQNPKTSSLGSNAAAAHGYKPSGKPVPKQTRGQRQDLKSRAAPSEREKEFAYATRMRKTQPAEAKRQGDIVRTERKLKAKYDLATGNYVRTNKRRFLPDEKVVIDPKTRKATTDITAATKQSGAKHAEVVAPALKVLEQTQRTVKATAGGARAAIRGEGPVGVLKAQKKGLLENKGPTWGKVLHEDLKVPKPAAAVAGFAADVATDPTTYVTGGTGKVAVKGAEKAAKDAAKKAAAKGMSDAGVKTVQKAAAKKAVRQAGEKGQSTGVTVRFAGKELPGVRSGTAAVGRGVKRVTPARVPKAAKGTVAHVRPQITPEGMTKAEHVLNRQTERRARAQRSRGVREAQALAEAHRGRLKPEEWEQVQHAIETRKLKNLPDHLRQPAIDIRSANRGALRERRAAGVSQGDVTRRPAKPVQVSKPPKIVKTREFGKTGEREIVRPASSAREGRSGTPPAQAPPTKPLTYKITKNEDDYGRELGEKFQVEDSNGRLLGVAENRKQAKEIIEEDKRLQAKKPKPEPQPRPKADSGGAVLHPDDAKAVEDYAKSAAHFVNEKLRGDQGPVAPEHAEHAARANKRQDQIIEGVDRAIDSQAPSKTEQVLHRFLPHRGEEFKVGAEIRKPEFTSTSKTKGAVGRHAKEGDRITIRVPAGTKALDVNKHGLGRSVQEDEVILPRDMTFVVEKVTDHGNGLRDIEVRAIPKGAARLKVQQFGPREVSRAVGRRQTARMVRPKREPGAPKEYMPHMRASLIEGEQEAAKAGAKGGTRKIGSTMKRQMNVPVREANERLGADERFSTNVPLVQANYRVQTANAVAGARMARDLGERAPKVKPRVDKDGRIDLGVPDNPTHAVYRLAGGKLDEVDEKELTALAHGKGKAHGQLVSLNKQAVESFKKQFVDDRTAAGKGFDFVQGKWKRVATFTPGFHVRNMIGDTQMAYLAQPGHRMPGNVRVAGAGLKRMTQREAQLRKTGAPARAAGTVRKHKNIPENEGLARIGRAALARPVRDERGFERPMTGKAGSIRKEPGPKGGVEYFHFGPDGKPNGYLYVSDAGPKPGRTVYVDPASRRQGVARKMYERAKADGFTTDNGQGLTGRSRLGRQMAKGLKPKTVKIAGRDVDLDEFLDGAINEGVIRSGMIARGIDDAAADGRAEAGAEVSKRTLKGLRNTAAGGKLRGAVRPVKKAAASVNRGMQNREDLMRLATYKHGLDKGLTKPEAADLASAFHIDYGDVTDFERKVARRAAPFYTFSARALPIHVKALVNTPGKIAAIEKARQELAYGMGLDDGWEGDTPEWKQRAIPFGVKIKGENVALDAALPVSMLNELPTSLSAKDYATEMWKFGTGLLTPALKIPIEVGTNQSLFFRKPIKDPNTPYVSAPAWVKWLPEQVRNGLGVVEIVDKRSGKKVAGWDPWTNYAFRQLPGLATQFQQVTTQGALQSGRHDWQKWSGVAGVKADPIDPTTAAITKLFDKRNKIDMRLRQLGKQGQKGGKSSSNPEVRKLTKQLAGLDYQIYSNSVERGDAQPLRETAIPNPKLKKPRVVQRGLLKKGDQKAAAKKSGGGSGWGGGASTGSGW